ncbi:MAG: sulfite exporter TauE/SafE family protein [Thalassolituus sp.]
MPEYLTAGLEISAVVILIVAAFAGSLITAAFGVGGGAFLITVMASIVPPLALIPVHGVVQMGSNASRAWIARRYLHHRRFGWFVLGALIASVFSAGIAGVLDTQLIPLVIALFVLWITWAPVPDIGLGRTSGGLFTGGLLTTLASMLVGASGPLVSAWLSKDSRDKWQYTALFSSALTVQHLLKVVVFGVAGFAFSQWLPLMFIMILAGYLGTRAGLLLLGKIPQDTFVRIYRITLTLLSLRLLFLWYSGTQVS